MIKKHQTLLKWINIYIYIKRHFVSIEMKTNQKNDSVCFIYQLMWIQWCAIYPIQSHENLYITYNIHSTSMISISEYYFINEYVTSMWKTHEPI